MADSSEPRLLRIPGLLAGGNDWALCTARNDAVLTGDATGLRLRGDTAGPLGLTCKDGSLGRLTLPLGVAVDRDLRVYLLDKTRGLVLRHDPSAFGYDPAVPFVPLPAVGNDAASGPAADNPRRLVGATALAVDRTSLYVADPGSRRVLVFALDSWALRDVWHFRPKDEPWDVVAVGGEVFVLTPGRVWAWHAGDRTPRMRIEVQVGPLWYVSRLTADRAGQLYALARRQDGSSAKLVVYDPRRPSASVEEVPDAAMVRDQFRLPAVYTLPDESGPLQFVLPEPLARACGRTWPLPPVGRPVEAYFTHRPGPKDGGFVFDEHGKRVTLTTAYAQVSRLFHTGGTPSDLAWISKPLDSKLFGCRWDAISLTFADLPPGCRVEVSTYTADDVIGLEDLYALPLEAWAAGLAVTGPPRGPAADTSASTNFLVDSPAKQFLWLRIAFQGNGFTTPVLKQAEVHFPRRSYLEHLPAVFSEDEAGRRFLERFLYLFQAEWDTLEARAAGVAGLFDPRAVPDTHLDYLASWFGTTFENGWKADAKRRLLERLPAVFFAPRTKTERGGTRRGTPAALRAYVRAVLEAASGAEVAKTAYPLLVEGFRERDYRLLPRRAEDRPVAALTAGAEEAAAAGPLWGPDRVGRFQLDAASRLDEERLLPPGPPDLDVFAAHAHRFRVVVPAAWVRTPDAQGALRRAIEAEKPAHTKYELLLVRAAFRVGVQSTVGVDTILGGPSPVLDAAGAGLGTSILAAATSRPAATRLDAGVRLGVDPMRL